MRIFTEYLENPTTCRGLYCVWVPTREGAATPLVARWIDPQAVEKDASSFGFARKRAGTGGDAVIIASRVECRCDEYARRSLLR